jgi:DNA-binding MarR family transcriptional regulator
MESPAAEVAAGYLVKRVQQAFRRRSDATLKSVGVSMSQYALLRALADHPEASASELARLCFVTRQSLQDVLAGLRATQLVRDADTPPRGRARALQLTTTGRRRLAAADDAVMAVDSAMLQGFSQTDQMHLVQLLQRCAQNLEAGGD